MTTAKAVKRTTAARRTAPAKPVARAVAKKKPPASAAALAKPAPVAWRGPGRVAAPAKNMSAAKAIEVTATGIVKTVAGISTAAVAKATGHGWNYWLRALDKAGAATLPHREIVKVLASTLGLKSPWWLQMITVGYEQARGLRRPNQKPAGFVATVSRTVAVPIGALYSAWLEGRRGDWLPEAIEVRRATLNKSMKVTWPDGSGVDVNFYAKGGNKTVVAIEQAKLPDEGAVAAVKQLWGSALDQLKSTLERKR